MSDHGSDFLFNSSFTAIPTICSVSGFFKNLPASNLWVALISSVWANPLMMTAFWSG